MGHVVDAKRGGGQGWVWNASHPGRLNNLIATGFESDLTLILGPEQVKVPVHKIFLQAGSRVLNSAIKKGSQSDQLIIDTVDSRVFKLMLQYLYTGDSGAEMGDALQLLQLATEYEITELRDQCANLLNSDLTDDNVLQLFQGAMEFAHGQLIQSTLEYICRMGRKMLKREEFVNLRLECLVEIIQQDKLRVTDEMAVFDAVYRWGENECERQSLDGTDMKNLRKVVDKPLKYIRFPLMDSTEFALTVATKNILDMPELTTLLTCFLVPPERRNTLPQGRFSSSPRSYLQLGDAISYTRFLEPGSRVLSSVPVPIVETIMIRSQDDVTLCSLSIWKSALNYQLNHPSYTRHGYDSVFATVTITRGQETVFNIENSPLTVNGEFLEVKFHQAVPFPSGSEWYEMKLVLSGTIIYYLRPGTGYQQHALQSCQLVNNYGSFLASHPTMDGNYPGLSFKRKHGDTMEMTSGLIESFVFENV